MRNTKNEGQISIVIFKARRGSGYVAVCPQLALIREGGKLSPLKRQIVDLAKKYAESVIKNNLDERLLNQTLPAPYLDECKMALKHRTQSVQNNEEYLKQKWQATIEDILYNKKRNASSLTYA